MIRKQAITVRTISYGFNVAFNLLLVVISSRLLTPGEVGQFAWGVMLVQPVNDILVAGLGWSIIQRLDKNWREIAVVHGLAIALSIGVSGVIAIATLLIAPGFIPIAMWFLFAMLLAPTEGICSGILSHEQRFEHIAIISSLGVLTNLVVTTMCLYTGLGAISLAIGFFNAAAIRTSVYWFFTWPGISVPKQNEYPQIASYLKFGLATGVSKTLGNLAKLAPGWVVGPFMGMAALGLLTRAQRLGNLPADIFTSLIGGMLGPVFAKAQHDRARLAQLYLTAVNATITLILPFACVAIVFMPQIVRLLLGENWLGVTDLLRIFLLGSLFHGLLKISDDALRATGAVRFQIVAYIYYILTVVVITATACSIGMSLNIIVASIVIISIYRSIAFARAAINATQDHQPGNLQWLAWLKSSAGVTALGAVGLGIISLLSSLWVLWVATVAFALVSAPLVLRACRDLISGGR